MGLYWAHEQFALLYNLSGNNKRFCFTHLLACHELWNPCLPSKRRIFVLIIKTPAKYQIFPFTKKTYLHRLQWRFILFSGWEVRRVKNCDRGFQAQGHSFLLYGPTLSRQITRLFFFRSKLVWNFSEVISVSSTFRF